MRSERIVFARMSNVGLDPLAVNEAEGLEAAEQGIDGPLRDDQVGVAFEAAEDFQAVSFATPQGRENGELKTAFAKLDFPFIGRGVERGDVEHSYIMQYIVYCSQQLIAFENFQRKSSFVLINTIYGACKLN